MANGGRFNKLFEPGKIGKFTIKNRLLRIAAGTDYVDQDYVLKLEKELPYFEAVAQESGGEIKVIAINVGQSLSKVQTLLWRHPSRAWTQALLRCLLTLASAPFFRAPQDRCCCLSSPAP